MKRILPAFMAALLAATGCVNEKKAIGEAVSRFWQAVIDGKTDSAYRMLSKKSRFTIPKEVFEEMVTFGMRNTLENRRLRKTWSEESSFRIEEIEQRGDEALTLVSFRLPDMTELNHRLEDEARREGIYTKYRNDSQKIDDWFTMRMAEELEARRFSRKTSESRTFLLREEGEWKINLADEYH